MTTGVDDNRPDLSLADKATGTIALGGHKVDYNLRDEDGYTPLIREIQGGNTSAVVALLANNEVDPNLKDTFGRSPLHAAVINGRETLVKILLEQREIDPNSRDECGRSPLWVAASSGYKTIVGLLLDSDMVDADARDVNGQTTLSAASVTAPSMMMPRTVRSQEGVVELLLACGRADPDAKDIQGLTPLAWVSRSKVIRYRYPVVSEQSGGYTEIAKILLGTGKVDPNASNHYGITPLMWSEACLNDQIKKLLLASGRAHEGPKKYTGLDVDSRYISHWIESCNTQHGGRCRPTPHERRSPQQNPDWVIDITQGCLVPGHTASRYIALSYVWSNNDEHDPSRSSISRRANPPSQVDQAGVMLGQIDSQIPERLLLKKLNLLDFQKYGYLQGHLAVHLPAAVSDAIILVRTLGERYLWVDCLCIVQDDEKTREQVDHMGDIYSGAYFTIIAATSSGELNYHFPHAKESRKKAENLYAELYRSKWATRGWTFQEQMLSKRSVIFTGQDTFWECQECVWSMDGPMPELATKTSLARPHYEKARRMSSTNFPFSLYIEMVSLYNSRNLTYPQDILAAFSGVLNSLTRSFPSGFVCGLPRKDLDIALLWQPFEKAQRREAKDGGSVAASKILPSWSWCGWKCPVDPFHLRTRSTHININEDNEKSQDPMWKTHKLVEWSSLPEDMQCQSRIDGPSTSADGAPMEREDGMSGHIERESMFTNQLLDNDKPECGHKTPTQARIPKLLDADPRKVSSPQNTWPFLSCETSRAFLQAGVILRAMSGPQNHYNSFRSRMVFKLPQFAHGPAAHNMCDLICLEDKWGRCAGVLRRMDDAAIDAGDLVELIAISTGVVNMKGVIGDIADRMYRKDREPSVKEVQATGLRVELRSSRSDWSETRKEMRLYGIEGQSGREYHFYNVLWIERRGQIAYRRAAGRVPKEIWDANCTPPTKIILG